MLLPNFNTDCQSFIRINWINKSLGSNWLFQLSSMSKQQWFINMHLHSFVSLPLGHIICLQYIIIYMLLIKIAWTHLLQSRKSNSWSIIRTMFCRKLSCNVWLTPTFCLCICVHWTNKVAPGWPSPSSWSGTAMPPLESCCQTTGCWWPAGSHPHELPAYGV